MKKMYFIIAIISALSLFNVTAALSADTLPFYAASYVEPNVLIILDRSGSMSGDVGGGTAFTTCPAAADPNPLTTTGDYSRICIARQVLFDLLDANNSNSVTDTPTATADQTYLGVRLGYARFINVPSSPATGASEGGYAGGNIRVINDVGTSYVALWASINSLSTGDYTPLGTALSEAFQYFQNASAVTGDACFTNGCRKNYVILVTDGADTVTCTAGSADIANRRATVYAAQTLRNGPDGVAGTADDINVFVVGFGGSLPANLQNTLNWAAYYGGTDSPASTPINSITGSFTPGAALCDTVTGTANDPGAQAISGYAFLASNASELATAIEQAINAARTGSYTRSQPVLTISGNSVSGDRIYSGFFDLPGWKGHLDAWGVDSAGAITDSTENSCTSTGAAYLGELYDAGAALTNSTCGGYVAPSARNIYTAVGSPTLSRIYFNVSGTNTSAQQIDLCNALNISGFNCATNYADADTSAANNNPNELINFIRFSSTTFNGSGGTRDIGSIPQWKLGDIWHSTPTIVGPPVGSFSSAGYNAFKSSKSTRPNVLIVGANDGMLHAFNDSNNGSELWSFIPNNLLGTLKDLNVGHAFYVDASPTAADVCLNTTNCGKSAEDVADWKTVVITGERDGGNAYFALDITDTTNPNYLWQFTDANLGYTWSKPAIGKVRVRSGGNYEDHWATFFGGGTSTTNGVGNRFYAVDIGTGATFGSGTGTEYTIGGVANKVPSAPSPIDSNGDFYVDAVFFGDTDGRLWKLNTTDTNPNNWSAGRIFDPSLAHKTISCASGTVGTVIDHSTGLNGLRPIYYRPAVVFDSNLKPLIMFGTGFVDDNTQPGSTVQNYFYIARLESSAYSGIPSPNEYITELLSVTLDPGETVVGASFVRDGMVWYVTYTPPKTADCCSVGEGKLRWAEPTSCGATGVIELGPGIPQAGAGSDGIYTITSDDTKPKRCTTCPIGTGNLSDVIYWRER